MRKLKLFLSVLMLMAFSVGTVWGATTYKLTKVTSVSAGNKYVFEQNSHVFNNTCASSALQTTATYSTTKLTGTESYVWTLETATGGFYLKNVSLASNQYLNNTSKTTVSLGSASSIWTIAFTDGVALISNTSNANRYLGQPAAETYTYKAYATSDMSYAHAITVYQLEEEAACSNTVTITKGAETNGTYSLSATEICGDGEGEDVTISAITPKAGYAFDKITTSASGTVDNANTKVTGITANTTITVLFKELQKYTVKFNTGAGNPAQADIPETTAGEGITLPAGPTPACSSAGWSFAGWAEDAVASETTTAPTLLAAGDNYKPTDNVTLYAVYKRTEAGEGMAFDHYEKVTSNPSDWSGTYLLSANTSGEVYYTFNGHSASTSGTSIALTPGNTEQAACEVVVAKTTNGYSIKHKTEYLGLTSDGNNLNFSTTFIASNYEWTLSADNGAESVSYSGRYIECNTSSSYKVACYKATQKRFYLYKRIEAAASTTYYLSAPSCCTKHAINIAASIPFGKVEADLAEACEGTVVTLSTTPNDHCRFVEWDVKQGETPVSVSDSKFTMPDGNVTVSATFAEIRNAVNVVNPGHGTINVTGAANLDEVLEGDELEVSVSGSGYKFTLKAYKDGDETTIVPVTDGKLTMPAYDIVITANEEKLVSPTILVNKSVIDFGKAVKAAAAPAAETFTISGSNLTGDLSLAWETDDAYFAWEVTEGSLAANAGIVEATIRVNVTAKGMSTAGMLADNLVVSGGGAAQQEVTVGIEVQETYTAKWYLNGAELTESTQTAIEGTNLNVPADPTKLADDCAEMVFKGWAAAEIEGSKAEAPEFVTTEGLKMGNANVNYYAVFATKNEETTKVEYQYTIPLSDFNKTSYAANNNEKTVNAVCTTDESKKEVKYTTNQVMLSSDGTYIQGQKNTGYIYNAAAWGSKVKSITINGNENFTYVIGASAQPTATAEGAFFKISAGSETSKASSIEIVFEVSNKSTVYSNYVTTCPSCSKVTLNKAIVGNGTLVLKQSGVEVSAPVKTCEAATVNVEATPATGYELDGVAVSGVEGAAYNAGVISIPQDAAGTLTVTATFTAIDYTVTMEQTGGAEAEISGNQENKHYGIEITVTAGEKAGYYFLGWAADVEVEFANAKALTTTFPMPASNVKVTAKYAKILSVAEALALIPSQDDKKDDQVVEGYIKSVESYSSTYKSITYTLMDLDANGFATATTIKVFGGKGIESADFSAKDDLEVGAKARIFGQLLYHSTGGKEINSDNYQLSYTAPEFDAVVIYGEASKTAYEKGAAFEFDGLSAKNTYKNGYATAIESPVWAADPATINAAGTVNVTAKNADEKISAVKEVTVTVNTHKVIFKDYDEDYHVYLSVKNGLENVSSGDEFVKGTVLTVEPTYTADDVLKTLTANEVDIKTTKTVIIGEENVTISATTESKPLAPISWLPASASIALNGDVATLPTLSNEKGLEIRYTCDKDAVATIDENTGEITLVGVGEATITAQSVATPEGAYMTTFAQLILTVTDATYAVNFAAPTNGTLVVVDKGTGDPVADGAKFVKGDELQITAAPNAGYKLETLTVNGVDFENGEVYEVGTEDITIVATFVKDSGTAIDNTEAGVKAVKMIENGVLIIRRGDKSFNAQGQLIR